MKYPRGIVISLSQVIAGRSSAESIGQSIVRRIIMLRAAENDAAEGPYMTMVVVFAMLFVLVALGSVVTLMIRSHRHEFHHGPFSAGNKTHGVK
jgi:hypothetical protein